VKVFAPGKMVLTGAYAVLRGHPSVVVAVSRGAVADDARRARSSREVRAALGTDDAPEVDTRALYEGSRKLGLGASAAVLVSTLGLRAHAQGKDLADRDVRRALFLEGRRAHEKAQAGGSGVDVAASVYGGALVYRLDEHGEGHVTETRLPENVGFHAYAARTSARTTELRAVVDRLRTERPVEDARLFEALGAASRAAAEACLGGDASAFVAASIAFGESLSALGRAADAPIFSMADEELARLARSSGSAFHPSGAGGGDVAVLLGTKTPTFDAEAVRLGYEPLPLTVDPGGVRAL
jgi:phosphomevalonate kinase